VRVCSTYRHDELVGPCHCLKAIFLNKLIRDVLPERVACASRRDAPACAVVGVGPEQVAHGALMGHLHHSIDVSNHIKGVQARRQTTVQAENLILDHSRQRQVVKKISEVLPYVCVAVLAQALVVEAVDLSDLARLVVTAQDRDALLESHFQADEQSDRLHAIVPTIDIVAHKQVVRVGGATTDLK